MRRVETTQTSRLSDISHYNRLGHVDADTSHAVNNTTFSSIKPLTNEMFLHYLKAPADHLLFLCFPKHSSYISDLNRPFLLLVRR